MKRLPENMAMRMAVHNTTVETERRRKTCILDGDGVVLAGADMGAEINRRSAKSQRGFAIQQAMRRVFEGSRLQRQKKRGRTLLRPQ
jgi:hypothetical protein